MLEFPEAVVISQQLDKTIKGKKIKNIIAGYSPHKFAFFHGEPEDYCDLLSGKIVDTVRGYGGMVEVEVEDTIILFADGIRIKFLSKEEKYPKKHQLLIEFEDSTALICSVQMYGGLWCFKEGQFDNPYYKVAKEKPSPLSKKFDKDYFEQLISLPEVQELSAKAFLATEQRVPGLGNGTLQDILYNAKIHPKRKIKSLADIDKEELFFSIKSTFDEMISHGGRDTEKDIFGSWGGYKTLMSRNTVNKPCPVCGAIIKKQSYMGGSIYYCEGCQML